MVTVCSIRTYTTITFIQVLRSLLSHKLMIVPGVVLGDTSCCFFSSDHRFSGDAWGINVESEPLAGGGYRYEITGTDWGQSIGAGQTIQVGFNALTGITENVNIPLTEALLVADGGAMTVI